MKKQYDSLFVWPSWKRMAVLVFVLWMICSPLGTFAVTSANVDGGEIAIGFAGWQPNARTFLFHVPFHRQERSLSCEVASLRSALLGIGIDVPERELWKDLPKDPTPKRWTKQGLIWGDPSVGFVGNVNGRMPKSGYGVFVGPLETVAKEYASPTRIRVDDPSAIDAALAKGHPIITWSSLGVRPSVTTWKTTAGKTITAPLYEHTIVIVGYRGTAEWIEGLYVIDPTTSLRYEPWNEFQYRTSFYDHVGLVIAPK